MNLMKVTNPANGEVIKEIPKDSPQSVIEKFQRAKTAQKSWASESLAHRVEVIKAFRGKLERDKEELAQILTSEVGKPISQARNEVQGTLGRIDFFLENIFRVIQDDKVFEDQNAPMEEIISHEPLGVIANISAWNYPYFVGSNVFIPALLTGNAVLYKPSEFSSLTGLAIADRLYASGVPGDVFSVVIGDGLIGGELLKCAINGVFFTGSYLTGSKIIESVSSKMIKIQLELGGKDPTYVCEDVDLQNAAESLADGAFYNAGQSCCSVERIYVHEKVYDQFVEKFVNVVKGFVVGNPNDDKTYIGPLTRSAQLSILKNQVTDALGKGAKLLCGGHKVEGVKGNYFQPTVFSNVNHTMELMREESFGPIIGLQRVTGDEEALKLMNETAYGLTAGVYTKNRNRAMGLLKEVSSGSVYWNCCDRVSPRLPWSGRGHSGIGETLSVSGMRAFLQPKAWHLRGIKP